MFRVTTYLDVAEPLRPFVQGALLGALMQPGFARLESSVDIGEDGLAVALKLDADSESAAAQKARYWIERAAKSVKGLRWTGKTTKDPEVAPWT